MPPETTKMAHIANVQGTSGPICSDSVRRVPKKCAEIREVTPAPQETQ